MVSFAFATFALLFSLTSSPYLSGVVVERESTVCSYDYSLCTVAAASENGSMLVGKGNEFVAHPKVMEDAFTIDCCDESDLFFAVYDGHDGNETSSMASKELHHQLRKKFEQGSVKDFREAVTDVFLDFDKKVTEQHKKSGATASLAWVRGEHLYVANLGDSTCIVVLKDGTINAAREHKPTDLAEKLRIEEAGGFVCPKTGRLIRRTDSSGILMSRALGDDSFKPLGLSAKPYVMRYNLCDVLYVFLASDGVMDIFEEYAEKEESKYQACIHLLDDYMKKKSLTLGNMSEKDAIGLVSWCIDTSRPVWESEDPLGVVHNLPDDMTALFIAIKDLTSSSNEQTSENVDSKEIEVAAL